MIAVVNKQDEIATDILYHGPHLSFKNDDGKTVWDIVNEGDVDFPTKKEKK